MSDAEKDYCIVFCFWFLYYKFESIKRAISARVFELKRLLLEPEDKQNWMIFKILKSGLSNFCCANPNHRQPFTLLSLRQLAHLFEKAEGLTDLDNFYWKTLLVAWIFGVMGALRS